MYAPQAHFVFHDAFNYDPNIWNDLFADDDVEKVAIDHHYYQAWSGRSNDTNTYCDQYDNEAKLADEFKYEVWFGEWSLATDVCAMWLGGFNDGNAEQKFEC